GSAGIRPSILDTGSPSWRPVRCLAPPPTLSSGAVGLSQQTGHHLLEFHVLPLGPRRRERGFSQRFPGTRNGPLVLLLDRHGWTDLGEGGPPGPGDPPILVPDRRGRNGAEVRVGRFGSTQQPDGTFPLLLLCGQPGK